MCSFKKVRDDVVLVYDSSHIDGLEFVVLLDIVCRGKNPEFPSEDYNSFSLEETDAVQYVT